MKEIDKPYLWLKRIDKQSINSVYLVAKYLCCMADKTGCHLTEISTDFDNNYSYLSIIFKAEGDCYFKSGVYFLNGGQCRLEIVPNADSLEIPHKDIVIGGSYVRHNPTGITLKISEGVNKSEMISVLKAFVQYSRNFWEARPICTKNIKRN